MAKAGKRTGGHPRALEMLVAFLASDRDASLAELLDDEVSLPADVTGALIGKVFNRLDTPARLVFQALAVYGHPVTDTAIDHLLLPYLSGLPSKPILARLVRLQLAKRGSTDGRYSVHPVDAGHALSQIPIGLESDRSADPPPFTQLALLHRAAEYFMRARKDTIRSIEDLRPYLIEIDLLTRGGEYEAAAHTLHIASQYLMLWGDSGLVVNLGAPLRGKLEDPAVDQANLANLGRAYLLLGDVEEAVQHYNQALVLAREQLDEHGAALLFANLGACFYQQGRLGRAAARYRQALVTVRQSGDRLAEAQGLGGLGLCDQELGRFLDAADHYERALELARAARDRRLEGELLARLCALKVLLGHTSSALEHLEEGLAIARQLDFRMLEADCHNERAKVLIDLGRLADAAELAQAARAIATNIADPRLAADSNHTLALARLYSGATERAREAAQEAVRYSPRRSEHTASALLGVIALLQGDPLPAYDALGRAAALADRLLKDGDKMLYSSLDTSGLALTAVALLGEEDRVDEAIAAYRAARAITNAPVVVARVLRLLDSLGPADQAGVLAKVRPAAGGHRGV